MEKENKITLVRITEFILKERLDSLLPKPTENVVPSRPLPDKHTIFAQRPDHDAAQTDKPKINKQADRPSHSRLTASNVEHDPLPDKRWLLHPANRAQRRRRIIGRRAKPVTQKKTETQKKKELAPLLQIMKDAKRDMVSTPTHCHSSDEILPEK